VLDCLGAARVGRKRALAGAAGALMIALLSLASFFIGYTFAPGVDGFRFPYGDLLAYPRYAALMFANVFGLKVHDRVGATFVGVILLACAVGVLAHHLRLMVRRDAAPESRSRVVALLLGFALVFALLTAVGRAFLGVSTADSSRYYLYLVPGILGLYFHLLTLRAATLRRWGVTVLLLAALAAGLHLSRQDEAAMAWVSNGKRAWRNCYLETEDIAGCDRATRFKIYPRPEATGLKQKLDFLERNRLNLYAGEP
jgi:hypothetical protein